MGVKGTAEAVELGEEQRESKEKRFLDRGSHYRVREKPGARETPRNPQG